MNATEETNVQHLEYINSSLVASVSSPPCCSCSHELVLRSVFNPKAKPPSGTTVSWLQCPRRRPNQPLVQCTGQGLQQVSWRPHTSSLLLLPVKAPLSFPLQLQGWLWPPSAANAVSTLQPCLCCWPWPPYAANEVSPLQA